MTASDETRREVLVVELGVPAVDCWACGVPLPSRFYGIPIYEDQVLPNDWTGEWGGVPACARCAELQAALARPVPLAVFAPAREPEVDP